MTDPALDDLELDALTELVNLGVSQAAFNLREMVGHQVILSVPSIALLDRKSAIETLSKSEPSKLVAVHQVFEGDINGRVLLIFPEAQSLELVRAVTSSHLPLEDIIELEQEALAETGNVISERLPRHNGKSASPHIENISARDSAGRQPRTVQSPASAGCRGRRSIRAHQFFGA